MPNGLTLFNLFCGIYAIILAIRGEFAHAPAFIVVGGIADALDGRVARATGTGSRFGEELDSLVDAISFGLAPALIMYFAAAEPRHVGMAARLHLHRVRRDAAGALQRRAGGSQEDVLPRPAQPGRRADARDVLLVQPDAALQQTVILFTDSKTLSDLPWHVILRGLMAVLAALMISDVPYPTVPAIGCRTPRKLLGSIVVLGSVVLLARAHARSSSSPLCWPTCCMGPCGRWCSVCSSRAGSPDEAYGDEEGEPSDEETPRRQPVRTPPGSPPRACLPRPSRRVHTAATTTAESRATELAATPSRGAVAGGAVAGRAATDRPGRRHRVPRSRLHLPTLRVDQPE